MNTNEAQNVRCHEGPLGANTPPIVLAAEWMAAREQMVVKEKTLTRARDALAADRRRMP